MNARNRNRTLWLLIALVVAYTMTSVAVYYATGTYGATWLVVTLAVYGVVLVAALAMLVRDRPTRMRARLRVARVELPPLVQENASVTLVPAAPEATTIPVQRDDEPAPA